MTSNASDMCDVCGKPGRVTICEVRDETKTSRTVCLEHAPPEIRDKMHRTPAQEVAFLYQTIAGLDQHVSDPAKLAEFKAEIEQLIAEIEAGRRRLDDGS